MIQKYLNGDASEAAFAALPTRVDLAHSLLDGKDRQGTSRRLALLVKNLRMSGGNRVIINLFDRLHDFQDTEIHVFVVPEVKRHIGEVWDFISCKRRYRAAASVMRATRPLDPGKFDTLISTAATPSICGDLAHRRMSIFYKPSRPGTHKFDACESARIGIGP
jgi:hypothetical protein